MIALARVLIVAGLVGILAVLLTLLVRAFEGRDTSPPVWCLPVLFVSAVVFSIGVVWSRDR